MNNSSSSSSSSEGPPALIYARKVMEVSLRFQKHANVGLKYCEDKVFELNKIAKVLTTVDTEINLQLRDLDQINSSCRVRVHNLKQSSLVINGSLQSTNTALNEILTILREEKVPQALGGSSLIQEYNNNNNNNNTMNSSIVTSTSSTSSKSSKRTSTSEIYLYSFVNDEALNSLNESVTVSVRDLNNLQEKGFQILDTLSSSLNDITSTAASRPEVNVNYSVGDYNLSDLSLKDMVEKARKIVMEIDKLGMEVSGVYDSLRFAPNLLKDTNVTQIQEKGRQNAKRITLIKQQFEDLQKIQKELSVRHINVESAWESTVSLHSKFIEYESILSTQLSELSLVEREYDKNYRLACDSLDEMGNLIQWYHLFHSSFLGLIDEIKRRNNVHQDHLKIAENYSKQLLDLYTEEFKARDTFSEFAHYLPPSLLKGMDEPPTHFTVVGNLGKSSLPVLIENQESMNTNSNS